MVFYTIYSIIICTIWHYNMHKYHFLSRTVFIDVMVFSQQERSSMTIRE